MTRLSLKYHVHAAVRSERDPSTLRRTLVVAKFAVLMHACRFAVVCVDATGKPLVIVRRERAHKWKLADVSDTLAERVNARDLHARALQRELDHLQRTKTKQTRLDT